MKVTQVIIECENQGRSGVTLEMDSVVPGSSSSTPRVIKFELSLKKSSQVVVTTSDSSDHTDRDINHTNTESRNRNEDYLPNHTNTESRKRNEDCSPQSTGF